MQTGTHFHNAKQNIFCPHWDTQLLFFQFMNPLNHVLQSVDDCQLIHIQLRMSRAQRGADKP